MFSFRQFCALGSIATACLSGTAATAQGAQESYSREVVQPLPPRAATDLSDALRQLSSSPRDGQALLKAGWASLTLNDSSAAVGFFTRAEALGTVTAQARAGLAAAQIYLNRPVEAVQMFAEAEQLGLPRNAHANERGLAYDLVGDNARAQEFYRLALAAGPDEEITRRLALSQAIAGDQNASETTLLPLLQRRDLAAYRTRAFALAALGKTEEAVAIADAVMPATLASKIAPYLRYMPRLTRAQQAAAGLFGNFPEASAIGRDDPRIATFAQAAKLPVNTTVAVDARLVPAGAPLGQSPQLAANTPATQPTPAAAPAPTQLAAAARAPQATAPVPATQPTPAPLPSPAISLAQQTPPAAPVPTQAAPVASAELAAVAPAPIPAQPVPTQPVPTQAAPVSTATLAAATPAPSPVFTLSPSSPAPAAPAIAAAPVPAPARIAEPAPEPIDLAAAFADFSMLPQTGPVAGAVDITKIKPKIEKKPEPEVKAPPKEVKPAKPPKPVHPSRVWVQVGTGRDKAALAFDWRKYNRESAKQFSGRKAYVAKWGQTNRLLTGPFDDRAAANTYLRTLKQAGIDSFLFLSDEGEAVDPLPGG